MRTTHGTAPPHQLDDKGIQPVASFFTGTATTVIYPLSLHDALPISGVHAGDLNVVEARPQHPARLPVDEPGRRRSEEHTSELQSHSDLVCRLLLEKKKELMRLNEHNLALYS